MSSTLLVLAQSVAKELGYASGVCSAAGTTTTIVDASTDSPIDTGDSETLLKNAWAKIEADSAVTPLNVGSVRRIKSVNTSTGTLTLSAALADATTTTQSYGIYLGVPPTRLGLHKGLLEYINDALRSLHYRSFTLLTLVTDGDMEASATSNWTAVMTTLAKVTTAGNVMLGGRSMSLTNSALSGTARSTLINVAENQNYSVMADVRVTAGTARLQLYDETNGAVIDAKTSDEREWRYLWFQATIPSGCKRVEVRLVGDEASAIAYWDNVSLRNQSARLMSLPSWIAGRNAVEDLEFWSGGSNNDNTYAVDERHRSSVHWFDVAEDQTGSNPWRIEFEPAPPSDAFLILRALRPYSELSADTDTTDANADLVKASALVRIYQDKNDEAGIAKWLPIYREYLAAYQPRITKRIRVGTM